MTLKHNSFASVRGNVGRVALDAMLTWPIAVALLASGVAHISNPYYFLGSVYSYGILTPRLGLAVAVVLPTLMIVMAICVLCEILRDAALHMALGLFGVFAVAQAFAWLRHSNIECGCFGPSYGYEPIGLSSLVTVVALLALTGVSIGRRLVGR